MKGGDEGKWTRIAVEAAFIQKHVKSGVHRTGEVLVHAGRIIHLLKEIEEGLVQEEEKGK